jgi:hypothetical protein
MLIMVARESIAWSAHAPRPEFLLFGALIEVADRPGITEPMRESCGAGTASPFHSQRAGQATIERR